MVRIPTWLGWEYEQLFPIPDLALPHPAFTVVAGDYVTTEDGTGIVHLAKALGADDFRTLVQNNVPGIFVKDELGNEVPVVDKQGKFLPLVGEYLAPTLRLIKVSSLKSFSPLNV